MDVNLRPTFANPSTSYLHEEFDKKEYPEEDLDYQYPTSTPLYPPLKSPKTSYNNVDLDDEGDFSESRQALHQLPPAEKDTRSCVQRVSPISAAV